MTVPLVLWAKSDPPLSLECHSNDTADVAMSLFGPNSRIGRAWIRAWRLDGSRFLIHVIVAALFHDLGKANAEFYRFASTGSGDQSWRHEWISTVLVVWLWDWLQDSGIDAGAIAAAVLSHHFKASPHPDDGLYYFPGPRGTPTNALGASVELYFDHPEVRAIVGRIRDVAGAGPIPKIPLGTLSPNRGHWVETIERAETLSSDDWCTASSDRARFIAALKTGLVVADSVASGVARTGVPADWAHEFASAPDLTSDEIMSDVVAPRLGGAPLHGFQTRAQKLGDKAVVVAGCGSGKTVTAYVWAASVARRRPIRSVIFTYPTRATAREGFRGYVEHVGPGRSLMLYAGAKHALIAMRATDDPDPGPSWTTSDEDTLGSLGQWGRSYYSATVDQLLSFLSYDRSGACRAPVLMDSALVVDEVHAFDSKMWRALLALARRLDVPMLLMTATLPGRRLAELDRLGFERLETEPSTGGADDTPRYRFVMAPGRSRLESVQWSVGQILVHSSAGRKVLVVVNTVARVHEFAAVLRGVTPPGTRILVYHSQFRGRDRWARHQELVTAFEGQGPVIAIATQVCEMSLDIDADFMVTDVAPLSAVVQRAGRCARRDGVASDVGARGTVLVIPNDGGVAECLPYSRIEIREAVSAIRSLGTERVSRRDLSEAVSATDGTIDGVGEPALFASGWFARPTGFREDDHRSRQALLQTDVDDPVTGPEIRALIKSGGDPGAWTITVPRRYVDDGLDWMPKWMGMVPADMCRLYDPVTGFNPI